MVSWVELGSEVRVFADKEPRWEGVGGTWRSGTTLDKSEGGVVLIGGRSRIQTIHVRINK